MPHAESKSIINQLSNEIAKIIRLPDMQEKLIGQGLNPFVSGPEEFATLMKADLQKYAKIIKTANIRIEQ